MCDKKSIFSAMEYVRSVCSSETSVIIILAFSIILCLSEFKSLESHNIIEQCLFFNEYSRGVSRLFDFKKIATVAMSDIENDKYNGK